ncbi:MAG: hypothetical protein Q9165_007768 [Trypethelium subeluteriae]
MAGLFRKRETSDSKASKKSSRNNLFQSSSDSYIELNETYGVEVMPVQKEMVGREPGVVQVTDEVTVESHSV